MLPSQESSRSQGVRRAMAADDDDERHGNEPGETSGWQRADHQRRRLVLVAVVPFVGLMDAVAGLALIDHFQVFPWVGLELLLTAFAAKPDKSPVME